MEAIPGLAFVRVSAVAPLDLWLRLSTVRIMIVLSPGGQSAAMVNSDELVFTYLVILEVAVPASIPDPDSKTIWFVDANTCVTLRSRKIVPSSICGIFALLPIKSPLFIPLVLINVIVLLPVVVVVDTVILPATS